MKKIQEQIKIAAFDVDGTLLPNTKLIFEKETKEMFEILKNKNIKTVLATARDFATIGDFLEQLQPDYFIGANGSFIWDVKLKKFIYKKTLIKEQVIDVYHHFQDQIKGFAISDFDKVFYSPNLNLNTWFVKPNVQNYYSFDEELLSIDNLYLITINKEQPQELIKQIQEYINKKNFEMEVNSIWTKGLFLSPKEINKASTLKVLCKKLNLKMENLIAFGDGSNDFEMIEQAGYGVAMEQANQELKNVAQDIALDCEHQGVYLKLKELNLI
ncbi:YcsE-related riboflavin metabolism phosphatase [Mycoplasmopsis cricetuli]|uniref:YcsE-related riboflavin metabolism phosphatase n=1 Tax=Mycoplasmopsis cricetuli TaxID=171283 RepID=UPI00046F5D10|nr:HAD family hydrolase [Mycoplasmopsis cricetuli]